MKGVTFIVSNTWQGWPSVDVWIDHSSGSGCSNNAGTKQKLRRLDMQDIALSKIRSTPQLIYLCSYSQAMRKMLVL